MAKKSAIERDKKRRRLSKRYLDRRSKLKSIIMDRSLNADEIFEALADHTASQNETEKTD